MLDTIRNAIMRVDRKVMIALPLGLLVIVWIAGNLLPEDPPHSHRAAQKSMAEQAQAPGQQAAAQQASANPNAIEPQLASDFVKWWIGGAMDYGQKTARESHKQAFAWMTTEAHSTFEANFWAPEIAQGIETGQIVAAFQPLNVQPEAVNPDGSVVVLLSGTLVMQAEGQMQPVTHQIMTDFLVSRDQDGLRIAGLHNRSYIVQASSPY